MVKYNFKDIFVVPTAEQFVDIMLSRTNRQTPTIVRKKWKISSIRQFYMRKVRFTQQNVSNRFTKIIEQFPKLDNIHPFYADLLNVLYSKDHFKIALSQLNIARQIVNNIGKDYIKLLKYGDSLYRCKQLKRAALGRIAKIVRQQKSPLAYLEQVRQHLARLPSIDPHERTLMLTGFPNVGKSSFMREITNADVEIQDYAFTTKSLFVGHSDYNYLRWQVIDSPGVLDRPLEERNTIEMQAITALAHLNACIIFFIDLSPVCQYPISQQCNLFQSLSPLFYNKPCIIVLTKTDLKKFEQLDNEDQREINKLASLKNVKVLSMSNISKEGVMELRNLACDLLLSHRIEIKSSLNKLQEVENRLSIENPTKRDNKERPIIIPSVVLQERQLKKQGVKLPKKEFKSAREIEESMGGPGIYSFDLRQHWTLENDEWKYDYIPEFYDGKNVFDFYSNDIDEKLQLLEEEENKILEEEMKNEIENKNNNNENETEPFTANDEMLYRYIRRKQLLTKQVQSNKNATRDNRPTIGRADKSQSLNELEEKLQDLGIDTSRVSQTLKQEQAKKQASLETHRGRSRSRSRNRGDQNANNNEINDPKSTQDIQEIARSQSRGRSHDRNQPSKSRSRSRAPSKGISSLSASKVAHRLKVMAIQNIQREGRKHESDRYVPNAKPKHLFSGHRGAHKGDWR